MLARDPLTTNVVACRWERTPNGWRLWVKGRKDVSGEGETYEAAEEALIQSIMRAAPDPDAIIPVVPEFSPPLPASALAEPYLTPELYLVSGDEIFGVHTFAHRPPRYFDSLFAGGMCGVCRHGLRERTEVKIRVDYAPSGVDAGWIRAPFANHIRVFSDRFLALLSDQERSHLRLQPIEVLSGTHRKFYELSGEPAVRLVGVRQFDSDGLECTSCAHRSLRVVDPRLNEGGLYLKNFICAADLSSPLPECFTIGLGNEVQLCLTRERWDALRNHPHARGIRSQRVGVVAEEECERQPRIRNHRERCSICRRWPEPRRVDGETQAVFSPPKVMCTPDSFTWLTKAEQKGHVQITRKTKEPMAIWDMISRGERPKHIEFVSFRCPNCWRLGWIVLNRKELLLQWRWSVR